MSASGGCSRVCVGSSPRLTSRVGVKETLIIQKISRSGKSEGGKDKRERWVLLKIPRRDIDGVGEGK